MSRKKFIKYPSIPAVDVGELESLVKGKNVQVFEKLDGGNCQVRNFEDRVEVGSRANFLRGKWASKFWFPKLLKWRYSNQTLSSLPEDIICFGEWLGNHTIQYPSENVDKFYLIDVYDLNSKEFIEYGLAREFVEFCGVEGIEFLKPVFNGDFSKRDAEKLLLQEPSSYYEGHKEGLIIKDYESDPQAFYKLLHPDFSEERKSWFGVKVDPLNTVRIDKNLLRLLEEGKGYRSEGVVVDSIREDILRETGIRVGVDSVKRRLAGFLKKNGFSSVRDYFEKP